MKQTPQYSVYILPNENYCGMTSNVTRRKWEHEKNGKDASGCKVVFVTDDKKEALEKEKMYHIEHGMNGYVYSDEWREKQREKCLNNKPSECLAKQVLCIETGEVFDSVRECAKHFGGNNGNLTRHLNAKRPQRKFKGYTFKYNS